MGAADGAWRTFDRVSGPARCYLPLAIGVAILGLTGPHSPSPDVMLCVQVSTSQTGEYDDSCCKDYHPTPACGLSSGPSANQDTVVNLEARRCLEP